MRRWRENYLGDKKYDPVNLGLDIPPTNRGHEFNDRPKGNGVIGHKLSEEERVEIIEYLKRL